MRCFKFVLLSLLQVVWLCGEASAQKSVIKSEKPARADAMLDFVGINFGLDGATNSPESKFAAPGWGRDLLIELGVRSIRSGIGWKGFTNQNPPPYAPLVFRADFDSTFQRNATKDLARWHGVKTLMNIGGIYSWANPQSSDTVDSTLITQQMTSIRDNYHLATSPSVALADVKKWYAVDGIEGQNEYTGSSNIYPQLAVYTKELPKIRKTVFGATAAPKFPLTLCTLEDFYNFLPGFQIAHDRFIGDFYGDDTFGNYHFYPVLNVPSPTNYSAGLQAETRVDFIRDTHVNLGTARREMMITEVNTFGNSLGEGSLTAQAKDASKYCCEFFRMRDAAGNQKVKKIYFFSMFGEWSTTTPPDRKALGFLSVGYTNGVPTSVARRPVFYALKNFLAMLREKSLTGDAPRQWTFPSTPATLKNLNMGIFGQDSAATKWQLFQKGSKKYLLALWQDIPVVDRHGVDLVNGQDTIDVEVNVTGATFKYFKLKTDTTNPTDWDYQLATAPAVSRPTGFSIAEKVPVPDTVAFLEITVP